LKKRRRKCEESKGRGISQETNMIHDAEKQNKTKQKKQT
jgi:hypothetical protein